LPERLSIDSVRPEIMPSTIARESGLPEGALRFALAAADKYPTSETKGHRRIISADSVMDPFAAEWEECETQEQQQQQQQPASSDVASKEVKCLLDLPDALLLALMADPKQLGAVESLAATCQRTSKLLLPQAQLCAPLLKKIRRPSVATVRHTNVLFWQASDLTDDDLELFAAWLDQEQGAPERPLHALYLNANLITDRGVSALLGCTALKRLHHLSLASNHVTDAGAMSLIAAVAPGGALAGLHELNMRGNPLTEAARTELKLRHDQNKMYVAV